MRSLNTFSAVDSVNDDGEPYNAEWSTRANPLIVAFFLQATDFDPDDIRGDQTPWCAAFVNWCLMRSGKRGTRSASSGSFRCVGNETPEPTTGDIAVFKNVGEDEACRGSGHVAFHVRNAGADIYVLGGNQSNRIKVSKYAIDEYPKFLSTRDIDTIP